MVDFNEWSQDPFALFAAFLTLVITVTFMIFLARIPHLLWVGRNRLSLFNSMLHL